MSFSSSLPGSPGGGANTPLQSVSHNAQRDVTLRRAAPGADDARDSSVHEKINQFNSLAMQSKQLERKTADAALKRAMLGREEAESEMRRYRDEARALKKQVDEGKERERRVGERLETVMENYGRAKETHAHTQALWEKEIRRARKETFKAQSSLVKMQEELKSCRTAQKAAEEELDREKERSKAREQEAFSARYSLVGLQEQLDQALERIKMVEQERDAFKMLAKNEEDVARIAAEGRIPLPPSEPSSEGSEDDYLASPKKRPRVSSASIVDIKSSATSEAEVEELSRLWQWERQRADRALDLVEFLEVECNMKCCPAAQSFSRSGRRSLTSNGPRRSRASPLKIADAGDLVILSETYAPAASGVAIEAAAPSPKRSKTEMLREEREQPRRSTIFIPAEGIFRTVSQFEAETTLKTISPTTAVSPKTMTTAKIAVDPSSPSAGSPSSDPATPSSDANPPVYARTPSVEPPGFAMLAHQRTSLLSLLDAPHQQASRPMLFNIPTTPGPGLDTETRDSSAGEQPDEDDASVTPLQQQPPAAAPPASEEQAYDDQEQYQHAGHRSEPSRTATRAKAPPAAAIARPHTAAACYTIATTTTKVPLRNENKDPNLAARLMKLQRTPSRAGGAAGDTPSFDVNNPALTPTMTREQALAQIRERRGRARSVAAGAGAGSASSLTSSVRSSQSATVLPAVTPRRQLVDGAAAVALAKDQRRDVSAPAKRVMGVPSVARRARS
ncbi:hypothetical protein B0T26DRAFT_755571 [Lasiosphaeria miniovina]|uniref:Uncharacterized protein n=1 Tax=Lasiosphaeria miniovina TaxID=1954250 RepID=A0AA39ZYN2_9PEZI|nr:uncharacterized protein B0T26DRAFT_755571 [Lasiosphaeria miniovina]KAK0706030.1 hypothetical protein B0T26DRAFT_755571 [Lasiosphaeria miniovina]